MNKFDVFLTIMFIGLIVLFSMVVGICVKQMFLEVELWLKIVACVGSHFALLLDVATIGVFVSLIDWEE